MSAGDLAPAPDHDVDALVIGGGLAGLSAAWELTRQGLRPLVVEARGYVGGQVARVRIGGVDVDAGGEDFVARGPAAPAVLGMVEQLGLPVEAPAGGRARLFLPPRHDVARHPGAVGSSSVDEGDAPPRDPCLSRARRGWGQYPFPAGSMMGIPSDPGAVDVEAVIGRDAARRAAQDLVMGPQVGQDCADVASFVEARMGRAVVDRLVGPIVSGIHTAGPEVQDLDAVLPGVRAAVARTGSLARAVAHLRGSAARSRPADRPVEQTISGGLFLLPAALAGAVAATGGRVLTRTGARSLRWADGRWEVRLAPTRRGVTPAAEPEATGPGWVVRTPRVVVACSAGPALRLLAGAIGQRATVRVPAGAAILRVLALVHAPALDAGPVGRGLLVARDPGGRAPVEASALSHLTLKWPGLAEQVARRHGAGVHLLRLSYGGAGGSPPDAPAEVWLRDLAVLTGVRLREQDVLDHSLVQWTGSLPPATPQYRREVATLESHVARCPGLSVTGAWVAGSGVAAVVAHARTRAGAGASET